MTTATDIADVLGLAEADVRYTIAEHLGIDLHEEDVPAELVDEVHQVLDPRGERTVPELYGLQPLNWRTADDQL